MRTWEEVYSATCHYIACPHCRYVRDSDANSIHKYAYRAGWLDAGMGRQSDVLAFSSDVNVSNGYRQGASARIREANS